MIPVEKPKRGRPKSNKDASTVPISANSKAIKSLKFSSSGARILDKN